MSQPCNWTTVILSVPPNSKTFQSDINFERILIWMKYEIDRIFHTVCLYWKYFSTHTQLVFCCLQLAIQQSLAGKEFSWGKAKSWLDEHIVYLIERKNEETSILIYYGECKRFRRNSWKMRFWNEYSLSKQTNVTKNVWYMIDYRLVCRWLK